jgi:hypothetical protein
MSNIYLTYLEKANVERQESILVVIWDLKVGMGTTANEHKVSFELKGML